MPGGTYLRFFDGQEFVKKWPATLSSYRLDRYEVTVGRFRAFVGAFAGPPPSGTAARTNVARSGWSMTWPLSPDRTTLEQTLQAAECDGARTWTATASATDVMPVNCVTWFEAFAFCSWDGGKIATAAELNYAAAGGEEQRVYPWSRPSSSSSVSPMHAVFSLDITTPSPASEVGSKVAGTARWGQRDLAGNMFELSLDAYNAMITADCRDCAAATDSSTDSRTIVGGAHVNLAGDLRNGHRLPWAPQSRAGHVGFRCMRSP